MKNTTDIFAARQTATPLAWRMPCGHGLVEGGQPANIPALAGRHAR
jgi:hypothetical protein